MKSQTNNPSAKKVQYPPLFQAPFPLNNNHILFYIIQLQYNNDTTTIKLTYNTVHQHQDTCFWVGLSNWRPTVDEELALHFTFHTLNMTTALTYLYLWGAFQQTVAYLHIKQLRSNISIHPESCFYHLMRILALFLVSTSS